jgi:hypothetical protein
MIGRWSVMHADAITATAVRMKVVVRTRMIINKLPY